MVFLAIWLIAVVAASIHVSARRLWGQPLLIAACRALLWPLSAHCLEPNFDGSAIAVRLSPGGIFIALSLRLRATRREPEAQMRPWQNSRRRTRRAGARFGQKQPSKGGSFRRAPSGRQEPKPRRAES